MSSEAYFEKRTLITQITPPSDNDSVPIPRQAPEELHIEIDPQTESILEDNTWQDELGLLVKTDLKLSAKIHDEPCGRLYAELRVSKNPEQTVLDRYVYLANIIVNGEREKGIGSSLLTSMERYAIRFGASRIEGIISVVDLKRTPNLPSFYKHRGYQLTSRGGGFKMVKPL